jgi:outer membrane protein OmpA-like peptidoglycan-associated protein
MRSERRQAGKSAIRLEVKRSTELWLYSFADMYMIISVLFISLTALYFKKNKELQANLSRVAEPKKIVQVLSANRGPAAAQMSIALEFSPGSSDINSEGTEQLRLMYPLISEVKSGVIDVEGYADTRGLASESEYDTNLELSSERALKVAQWFLNQGVSESRIRTTAFGRAHKFTTGVQGEMSDRRVVVKFYSAGTL